VEQGREVDVVHDHLGAVVRGVSGGEEVAGLQRGFRSVEERALVEWLRHDSNIAMQSAHGGQPLTLDWNPARAFARRGSRTVHCGSQAQPTGETVWSRIVFYSNLRRGNTTSSEAVFSIQKGTAVCEHLIDSVSSPQPPASLLSHCSPPHAAVAVAEAARTVRKALTSSRSQPEGLPVSTIRSAPRCPRSSPMISA